MGKENASPGVTWRSWAISIAAAILLSLVAGWFLGAVFHGGAGPHQHGGGAGESKSACGGCGGCGEEVKP